MTAAHIIALAKAMPEAKLQEQVRVLCRDLGLLYYHVHRATHSPAGFLDVVAVGANGMIYRELKTHTGKVSDPQQAWIAALSLRGCDVGVWRPLDLLTGVIAHTLADLGRLPGHILAGVTPPPRRTARR